MRDVLETVGVCWIGDHSSQAFPERVYVACQATEQEVVRCFKIDIGFTSVDQLWIES